jgi:outer membrane protein assembly factor BamB
MGTDSGAPAPPLEKAWEFKADNNMDGFPPLSVVAEDRLILFGSKDGRVYALKAESGQAKWMARMGKSLKLPLVESSGVVLAASGDKRLYALDAKNGVSLWQFSSGNDFQEWNSLVIGEGIVYVAAKDKRLHALDLKTGKERWQFACGGEIAEPGLSEGTVIFGSQDKTVYAVDAATGARRWASKTDHKKHSYPIVYGGKVLIGGDNDLHGLDPSTGKILWDVKDVLHYGSPPAVVEGVAYCTKGLATVDVASGEVRENAMWSLNDLSYVIEVDGTLYTMGLPSMTVHIHTAQFPTAYDLATKEEKWHACFDTLIYGGNLIVGGDFIYMTAGENLIVVNASKSTRRWVSESLPGGFLDTAGRPVLAHGIIFVTNGKTINAFRGSSDPQAIRSFETVEGFDKEPIYNVETLRENVVWPDRCCICLGLAEKFDSFRLTDKVYGLEREAEASGVPYCNSCFEKVSKMFSKEKRGVILTTAVPTTYAFRNERYRAMFMEANRLK